MAVSQESRAQSPVEDIEDRTNPVNHDPTEEDALLPKDPADVEGQAGNGAIDAPKVPGASLHLILPALAIGVSCSWDRRIGVQLTGLL
jgi:hypothetical protein